MVERVFDHADARRVHIETVALPPLHDLRVAGDDRDAGGAGGLRPSTGHDPLERRQRQAFLDDKAGAQPARPRPAHGEIVGRAENREPADVAAGEKERADHVRIRGEREPGAGGHVEHGPVMARIERRVGEGRAKDPLDQFLGEPPAAAVGELDLGVAGQRHGAIKVRRVWDGVGHATTLEPAGKHASRQPGGDAH